jgi:hypothetical protein
MEPPRQWTTKKVGQRRQIMFFGWEQARLECFLSIRGPLRRRMSFGFSSLACKIVEEINRNGGLITFVTDALLKPVERASR